MIGRARICGRCIRGIRGEFVEPTWWLAKGMLKTPLLAWFRWQIEGLEHIPKKGPALLAFNHIAYLDPLAAAIAVDRARRRPKFLAKSELFQDKRIAWILRGAGQIEVKRGTPEAPMALDRAVDALQRGQIVVVFPEGTITDDPDLNPMEAKTGIVRLALLTDVPVIPAALWGTANVWPKGFAKSFHPRQDICVRIGLPMKVEGDINDPASWKAAGDQIMREIGILVASLRPTVPDRRRPARKRAA
jgi:1-acyl-sn-glycerol-3-phosphate acyltransferase